MPGMALGLVVEHETSSSSPSTETPRRAHGDDTSARSDVKNQPTNSMSKRRAKPQKEERPDLTCVIRAFRLLVVQTYGNRSIEPDRPQGRQTWRLDRALLDRIRARGLRTTAGAEIQVAATGPELATVHESRSGGSPGPPLCRTDVRASVQASPTGKESEWAVLESPWIVLAALAIEYGLGDGIGGGETWYIQRMTRQLLTSNQDVVMYAL